LAFDPWSSKIPQSPECPKSLTMTTLLSVSKIVVGRPTIWELFCGEIVSLEVVGLEYSEGLFAAIEEFLF